MLSNVLLNAIESEVGEAMTMESAALSRGMMMAIVPMIAIVLILLAGLIMILFKEHKSKQGGNV